MLAWRQLISVALYQITQKVIDSIPPWNIDLHVTVWLKLNCNYSILIIVSFKFATEIGKSCMKTRKQNLQANSRSACQFWHKREMVVCKIAQYTGTLFLPQGVEIDIFFTSTGSHFQDTGRFSKLRYLGIKLGHWENSRKLQHTLSFYLQGLKLSLFSLYGQRFLKYWQFFEIAIFGQEAFPLAKVP